MEHKCAIKLNGTLNWVSGLVLLKHKTLALDVS